MNNSIANKIINLLFLGRYHKPYGSLLLMWPCFWGAVYANEVSTNNLWYLFLLGLGSFIMRGAGCTINDILDVKYDRNVSRTKERPLAKKKITFVEAICFLLLQLFIGLLIIINFDSRTMIIGFSIMPLVLIYPLFKRVTFFPQVVLGIIFNWGVIVGFSCSNDFFNHDVLFLYFAGVFLTIGYDTIYSYQDIEDDIKIGVKSMGLITKKNPKFYISFFYSISLILFTIVFFKVHGIGLIFLASIFLVFLQLLLQVKNIRLSNKKLLQKIFISNTILGAFVFLCLII